MDLTAGEHGGKTDIHNRFPRYVLKRSVSFKSFKHNAVKKKKTLPSAVLLRSLWGIRSAQTTTAYLHLGFCHLFTNTAVVIH